MTKGKAWDKKTWGILLGILCVAIVGLVVGIAVQLMDKNDTKTIVDGDPVELVRDEINAIEDPTVEQIIDIYQKYIDVVGDSEQKASLLQERIISIQMKDLYYSDGKQMIDDAIAIDNILKSTISAIQVMNVASTYGYTDIFDKYEEILRAREIEEGKDINMEVEG